MNNKEGEKVITRFAPSPTGFLHIGGARTALFAFLYARQHGGKLLLRIEDTDKARSTQEYEQSIFDGLAWLGISYDGEVYRQSERGDIYKNYLEKMLGEGSAFEAEENEAGSGKVIRFKNPNKSVTFEDTIRGEVSFDTTELGDFVIAKDADTPLYHLAVAVDDHESGVTNIIRGEDHISNTPRQILIQEAIGAERPKYAHIPLILDPEGGKLSKRKQAVSVDEYRQQGYLSQAVINFLALLGWHPKGEQEIFTMEELIEAFELADVQKGGATFDKDKLDWINKEHMRKLPDEQKEAEISTRLEKIPKEKIQKITPIILERINRWSDIDKMILAWELDYFFEAPEYDAGGLVWKPASPASSQGGDADKAETRGHIEKLQEFLSEADFESTESIKAAVWSYAEEKGKGNVLWPLRYALSGRDKSPDPFTLCYVLGKEETLARLEGAQEKLT